MTVETQNPTQPEAISEEALIEKLRASVASILATRFINAPPKKLEIEAKNSKLLFSCPYCGDSHMTASKKRGNLYVNYSWYKCYNTPCKSVPLFRFFQDFGVALPLSAEEIHYLKSVALNSSKKIFASGSAVEAYAADMFQINEYALPRSEIMKAGGFIEVVDNIGILNYLRSRLQVPRNGDMRHFAYDKKKDMIILFNLTRDRNHVIGLQGRFQKVKFNGQRFDSYIYSDIWKHFFDTEINEDIKNLVDKFSLVYNVLNVNYNLPIPIFEGGIDANCMSNSLATLSASSKIFLENGYYFYDNSKVDKAGRETALQMAKDGYKVFLWSKFLKDYPEYEYCKDLNDIVKKRPLPEQVYFQYFSTGDAMDLWFL